MKEVDRRLIKLCEDELPRIIVGAFALMKTVWSFIYPFFLLKGVRICLWKSTLIVHILLIMILAVLKLTRHLFVLGERILKWQKTALLS